MEHLPNEKKQSSSEVKSRSDPVVIAHVRFSKRIRDFMHDHNLTQSEMLDLLKECEELKSL